MYKYGSRTPNRIVGDMIPGCLVNCDCSVISTATQQQLIHSNSEVSVWLIMYETYEPNTKQQNI